MNTEEGNRLIAEFMGAVFIEPIGHAKRDIKFKELTHGLYVHSAKSLEYHSSYDWLMPVVEKIGSINYEFDISTHYGIEVSKFPMQSIFANDDKKDLSEPLIIQVWLGVIQFIEWYNKEQSVKESDTTKAT